MAIATLGKLIDETEDERSIIAWEIAYDNLRLSFDNYMLAAVLRR